MDQNGTDLHREIILVVDDAEPIRRMVMTMLMQSGYECLEAPDGTEALALLDNRDEPVHLVLTDLIMPKMTGAELATHLARLQPELPIIFMSGYTEDPAVVNLGRTRGNFLEKPFTAGALLEKVRKAINSVRPEEPPELRSGPGAS